MFRKEPESVPAALVDALRVLTPRVSQVKLLWMQSRGTDE